MMKGMVMYILLVMWTHHTLRKVSKTQALISLQWVTIFIEEELNFSKGTEYRNNSLVDTTTTTCITEKEIRDDWQKKRNEERDVLLQRVHSRLRTLSLDELRMVSLYSIL